MTRIVALTVTLLGLCAWLAGGSVAAQTRGIGLEAAGDAAATGDGGVYRALIIGNDRYRDPTRRWPSLKTAVGDARALSELLRHSYGFRDIELLENATRRDILRALERLSRRALPADSVLIYYAGHGFLDDATDRGFWVPVDAEGADNTTFLRNSTIRDEVSTIAARARHTLLISDSCFSGSLLRPGTRSISPGEAGPGYIRQVAARKSVQVLAAGGIEYVADDYRDSGHSPFTYFLLNELEANERELLTLSELSTGVTRAVANNVEQLPQSGVLYGAGDELGEFIFIRLKVTVDGVPAERVNVEVEVTPGDRALVIETDDGGERRASPGGLPLPAL